jgi:hypothetical protein
MLSFLVCPKVITLSGFYVIILFSKRQLGQLNQKPCESRLACSLWLSFLSSRKILKFYLKLRNFYPPLWLKKSSFSYKARTLFATMLSGTIKSFVSKERMGLSRHAQHTARGPNVACIVSDQGRVLERTLSTNPIGP